MQPDNVSLSWHSIEPLSEVDKNVDLADITSLYSAWYEAKNRFTSDRPKELAEFNQQLIRRLSVETGILERIYDLDVGTTESLVQHGFKEDLVSRSSTDINPARLIDILRDHEAAINVVMDWVGSSRQLTKGGLLELHSILLRHQETTTAVDQFGNRVELKLLKGRFKENPNNPKRVDGVVHQYCPPIHVDSEIEKLLKLHLEYLETGVDPIVHAAWLHHRFTQIHPFQDGNGRVVRALTTYVLLKANLLPLVVDRDRRPKYIESLEMADQGRLADLTQFIASLERSAITQALSVESASFVTKRANVVSSAVAELKRKLVSRHQQKSVTFRKVNDVALSLRDHAGLIVHRAFEGLRHEISQFQKARVEFELGGPEYGNSHWYKYEVVQTAKDASKFANFAEHHYFIKATLWLETERLLFVVSLHHVGRELSGVMEATAFARMEPILEKPSEAHSQQKFFVCSTEPFVFAYSSVLAKISEGFDQWLDTSIAVAVKEVADQL